MSETKQQEEGPMDAVRGALSALSNLSGDNDVSSTASGTPPPLRVSVLSGFLGAGKTTVLQHILHNSDGLRIAIIVNDMADVNIDANMLVSTVQTEEKMVALSNGCICCTLREDLFVNLAKLAARGDLDYVVVESSGISEPMPVAETFTFRDGRGTSLGDVAALDAMITVVDGESFLHELHGTDELRDRGWEVSAEDARTVAQLFCDQLEFANVIVLNKIDLMDDEGRERLGATLRRFNPSAQIIEAAWGQVEPKRLLGTNLFDMKQAEAHEGWLQEAREGEHTPETVEYGISSVTFRSRRPFNVQRFDELKAAMEKRLRLLEEEKDPEEAEAEKEEDEFPRGMLLSEAHHNAARRVIRSKGLVWLGNRQSHWQQAAASLAGRRFTVSYRAPWFAAMAGPGERPPMENEPDVWQEPYGDRRTELVVIGQDMDHSAILSALEACVLTDEEMNVYARLFLDSKPLDVIDEWAAGNKDVVVERLKRFEIEILAPRSKKTQVLAAAPISTTPVSAHSCIAIFRGGSRFQIEKYLRYAHLMPELASGLVKEFVFPDASAMDAQTTFLADQTTDGTALSDMLAYLEEGDRVRLEWLQIRVEMDTENDQDRFSIVEQCLKLDKLDEQAEKSLLREYPKPEIMIPKQDENKEARSCKVDGQPESDDGRKEKKARKGKKGKKRSKKRG